MGIESRIGHDLDERARTVGVKECVVRGADHHIRGPLPLTVVSYHERDNGKIGHGVEREDDGQIPLLDGFHEQFIISHGRIYSRQELSYLMADR